MTLVACPPRPAPRFTCLPNMRQFLSHWSKYIDSPSASPPPPRRLARSRVRGAMLRGLSSGRAVLRRKSRACAGGARAGVGQGQGHSSRMTTPPFTLDAKAALGVKPDIALIMADDVMRLSLGPYANGQPHERSNSTFQCVCRARGGSGGSEEAYCL